MTTETIEHSSLNARVAAEVRAALGRRRMSGSELARRLGASQTYVSHRLTGKIAFDLHDLEKVCEILAIDPVDLLPTRTPVGATGTRVQYFPLGHASRRTLGRGPRLVHGGTLHTLSPHRRGERSQVADTPCLRRAA